MLTPQYSGVGVWGGSSSPFLYSLHRNVQGAQQTNRLCILSTLSEGHPVLLYRLAPSAMFSSQQNSIWTNSKVCKSFLKNILSNPLTCSVLYEKRLLRVNAENRNRMSSLTVSALMLIQLWQIKTVVLKLIQYFFISLFSPSRISVSVWSPWLFPLQICELFDVPLCVASDLVLAAFLFYPT